MRGITPPSPRPHRRCRQSQRIQSLAYADLTRRNEHYQRRHWSIATSYNLLLPHRQCRHLPTPPSDDNQDNVDDEDDDSDDDDDDNDDNDDDDDDNDDNDNGGDDDEDEYNYNLINGVFDYDSDSNCLYNYNDLDNNNDDDNNNNADDNNDVDNSDNEDSDVSPLINLGTQHDGKSARAWMKRV